MQPLEFQPDENQKEAYQALVAHVDSGGKHGTICLVGDFLSGKTILVKRLLAEKFDTPADYYVNLNLYLIDELDKHSSSVAHAGAKAKIRLLMQIAIEDLLQRHFQSHNLIVLDAIEVTYPYELNLVSLANRFTCDGKQCIVCVPESPQYNYRFELSWELADIIRIA